MKPSDKDLVLRELSWVCDDPRTALSLLTDEESRDIIRRCYVSKTVWKAIELRLGARDKEMS